MTAPRLTIAGARKRFGGVHALRGVDLEVAAGEVHALLGENGAGKSTLMKVLSGAVRPDEGRMTLDGAPFAPTGPRDARRSGVAMIYQELNLCADLTVLENVTLGEETARAKGVADLGEDHLGLGHRDRGPDVESFGQLIGEHIGDHGAPGVEADDGAGLPPLRVGADQVGR